MVKEIADKNAYMYIVQDAVRKTTDKLYVNRQLQLYRIFTVYRWKKKKTLFRLRKKFSRFLRLENRLFERQY